MIDPKTGESYLDLTAGYGGHAEAFLERTYNYQDAVLVDRDRFAIEQLAKLEKRGATLIHSDFASAISTMAEQGKRFDIILADLGVSSPQLDRAERGFSFTNSGPLDMRMDNSQSLDAANYLAAVSERELADVIHRYGEEPRAVAARYAQAIVRARPLRDTAHLAEVISGAHKGRWQKIHPATRTFQAIRIVINDELGQVEQMLSQIPQVLNPGGRVGIISFHSLEDRLVKRAFAEASNAGYEAELALLTRKAISGTLQDNNPRARSAKLRVAIKK